MSIENARSQEVSVEVETNEHTEESEVVEEQPELRPSVEQDIQGKVDTNHPDVNRASLTLADEERLIAREMEIERTAIRFDRRQPSDREGRTRGVVGEMSAKRRADINNRDVRTNPPEEETVDPREKLSRELLGQVNKKAARLAEEFPDRSRAAIARQVARQVVSGADLPSAVLSVLEASEVWGQYVPIANIGEVGRKEVDIEGRVTEVWDSESPAIRQVGLIEDESGRVKFTSWVKSDQPWMEEGERVQLQNVAKNWYQGRVSVALTGWTRVAFPERGRYWK
jgi:hypothetical protein